MWVRWLTQPWWVRWLVISGVLLVVGGVSTLAQWLLYPGRFPVWAAAVLVGGTLAAAALGATFLTLRTAPYAAIIDPLTTTQRDELASVITPGPLPTDPAVLAAAARLRRMASGEHAAHPARKWVAFIAVALAYDVWLINQPGNLVVGTVFLAAVAFLAFRLVWARVRRRSLEPRWAAVIAAAEADPGAQDLLSATSDVPPQRDWRQWGCAIGAAVLFGSSYGVAILGIQSAQATECSTASSVVNYVYAHRDLLDSRRLADTEPSTAAYQQWAHQLAAYAAAGKASTLYADLKRVSDIADRIADTVELIRQTPATTPETVAETKAPFTSLVTQLISAEEPLATACQ